MSALAVQPSIAAPSPLVATGAVVGPEQHGAFAALLGQFAELGSEKRDAKAEAGAKGDTADSPAGGPTQSLEAALAALTLYTHSPRAPTASVDSRDAGAAQSAASALDAAVAALGSGSWDLSGKTPLKAQLAADPALGMSDFQIRTFLAAAGATPARTGATTLGTDSAWSPLDVARLAAKVGAAAPDAHGPISDAAGSPLPPAQASRPAVAPSAQTAGEDFAVAAAPDPASVAPPLPDAAVAAQICTPAAVPTPPTQQRSVENVSPQRARVQPPISLARAAGPASHNAQADPDAARAASGSEVASAGSVARRDRDQEAAPPVVAASAVTPDGPAPVATIALAQLPAFIADEARALAADAPAPSMDPKADDAPKAAQAVKELQISLDPANLGAMTLKLRLSGGKLTVTIAVANPQTLSAIEDDRALIAARLATGSQALDDLVIQRQALPASTQETHASHGSGSKSDTGDAATDAEAGESAANDRPSHRRRSGAGGNLRDLLV